ncbi:Uncharacterised protein [Mycobacteroides abscessus]|nr:Uncharacterised protein [Mycobacteroides abscessus]
MSEPERMVSGTAVSATARRHQRAVRHPTTKTVAATPVSAIHTHNISGAGLPLSAHPSDWIYQ